jgi:hypothetical protein
MESIHLRVPGVTRTQHFAHLGTPNCLRVFMASLCGQGPMLVSCLEAECSMRASVQRHTHNSGVFKQYESVVFSSVCAERKVRHMHMVVYIFRSFQWGKFYPSERACCWKTITIPIQNSQNSLNTVGQAYFLLSE